LQTIVSFRETMAMNHLLQETPKAAYRGRGLKAPYADPVGLSGGLNMLLRIGLSGSSLASLNGGSCMDAQVPLWQMYSIEEFAIILQTTAAMGNAAAECSPSSPQQRHVRRHPEIQRHTCRLDDPAYAPAPASTPAQVQQSVQIQSSLRCCRMFREED
jgi:hypothetical protein